MILTREFLDKGKTSRGGWTREQLRMVGVSWPPVQGWQLGVLGVEVTDTLAETFLTLGRVRKKTLTPKATPELLSRKNDLSAKRKSRKRVGLNKGLWAKETRAKLLSKENMAESHIDALLSSLPVVFRREHPLVVDKTQYFLDFIVISVKAPRRKLRLAIEVDGGYHGTPAQMEKDRIRERNLLATSRVNAILRIDASAALLMDKDELYRLMIGVKIGSVKIV